MKRLLIIFCLLAALMSVAFASPESFISMMAPSAQRIITPACGFPSVTIAQGGKESGWGTSELFKHNNPFGRKCSREPCAWILTPEYINGVRVMEWHPFQIYDSIDAALIDYCDKLNKPWYRRDFSGPEAFIRSIASPYASDPNYAASVWAIIKRYDLQKYDRRD